MSLDEFQEFVDRTISDETDNDLPHTIVDRAKKLFFAAKKADVDKKEKKYYKRFYIKSLLDYGFKLKGEWDNTGNYAKEKFDLIIRIDNNIPLAYYRLGHILFKNKEYGQAISNFDLAIKSNKNCIETVFCLESFQLDNAKKILAFCNLMLLDEYKSDFLKSEMYSNLNQHIQTYFDYLEGRSIDFRVVKNNELIDHKSINENEYYELKSKVETNNSFLYMDNYKNNHCVGYKGQEKELSFETNSLLRDIILQKYLMDEEIQYNQDDKNKKRLSRLRKYLAKIGLVIPEFQIIKEPNQFPTLSTDLTLFLFANLGD
jgi:tetratricopeptide (TPR) repeat protein